MPYFIPILDYGLCSLGSRLPGRGMLVLLVCSSKAQTTPVDCWCGAGFGDTAASVVGRLIGRHPVVLGGKKTWEGAGGGVGFTLLGWWLTLACCEATGELVQRWESLILVGATLLSCFLEAVTTQLDNLFVPLHYLTLLYCGSRLHRL